MDNKEFSKKLESRTLKFAVSILRLSAALATTPEGLVVRNQITKSGPQLAQIIARPTGPGAGLILKIRLRSVKVKQAKPNIG